MDAQSENKTGWGRLAILISLAILFSAIIFLIDLNTSLGIAIGAMYCIVILYCWLLPGNMVGVFAGLICTALVILGFILSQNTDPVSSISGINRIISIIVIWVCASLFTLAKRSFKEIEKSRDQLEQQVQERTAQLRQREADLKESEEVYRYLYEHANEMHVSLELDDGKIIKCNQTLCDRLGYTKEELIGKSIFYIYHPDSIEAGQKGLKKFRESGVVKNVERILKDKDGKRVHVILNASSVRDEEGKILYSLSSWLDVTDRIKMLEMLELTNQVARVGGFEADLLKNEFYWTQVSREIYEVSEDFIPSFDAGIEFFKEGENRERIQKAATNSIQEGVPFDLTLQIITAKGNERWLRIKGEPEIYDGKCIRLYGIYQDVHEEYLKDLKIAESEKSLKEAQSIAKVGSWQWDPVNDIQSWTEQMCDILGTKKNEDTESIFKFFNFVHPDDIDRVQSAVKRAVKNKRAMPLEYRIISKDGKLKYIRGDGNQTFDENGNLIRMYGTIQDISELVKLKSQFEAFFYNSLELMSIANMKGYFLRLNPKWEETLGYTDEELMSKPFVEFVHPEDVESTIEETKNMGKGNKSTNFINRYRAKNGTYRWLEWTAGLEIHEGLIYATARDITRQIEDEHELKKYAFQLENKNKELEQFAYIASHDLQEPLRTVSNISELFAEKYQDLVDDRGKKMIGYITQGSARMSELIKGLLEYSRLGYNSKMAELDCNVLVEELREDLAWAIEESRAKIEVGKLPTIDVYPTELRLLFQNLLSNAIKFRQPGNAPVIKISAKKERNFWQFSIKDNGIGIDPGHFDKIFLIFQRLHHRKDYEGTGIGLSHCRKIVELHGGKIWVESKPGKGSAFRFTISY